MLGGVLNQESVLYLLPLISTFASAVDCWGVAGLEAFGGLLVRARELSRICFQEQQLSPTHQKNTSSFGLFAEMQALLDHLRS